MGKRGSVYPQFNSPGQPTRFSRATKKVLACSHSRSLQLLYTVGGNQARLDGRTEFKILERSLKGGVEAGHAHSCIPRGVLPKTLVVLGKALKSRLVLIFWL